VVDALDVSTAASLTVPHTMSATQHPRCVVQVRRSMAAMTVGRKPGHCEGYPDCRAPLHPVIQPSLVQRRCTLPPRRMPYPLAVRPTPLR
jgi:hypothetical protein